MSQLRRELKEFIAELKGPKHEPKEYILRRLEKLLVKEKPVSATPPKLEVVYLIGGRKSGRSSKLAALATEMARNQGLIVLYVSPDHVTAKIHADSFALRAMEKGMSVVVPNAGRVHFVGAGDVLFISMNKNPNPQLWPQAYAILLDDVPVQPVMEYLPVTKKIVCAMYLPGHGRPGVTVEELSPLADSVDLLKNGISGTLSA